MSLFFWGVALVGEGDGSMLNTLESLDLIGLWELMQSDM